MATGAALRIEGGKYTHRGCPGGPMVRTPGFHCMSLRCNPGRETKISQVMHGGQKKNRQTHKEPRMLLDPEQVINVN